MTQSFSLAWRAALVATLVAAASMAHAERAQRLLAPLAARKSTTESPAPAASYIHDAWTTENGLPQSSVTSIVQTRDGYIWMGTFGGLVRFDGVKFDVFDTGNSPGFAGNRITYLYEDRASGLWIAFENGGLARYDRGQFRSYSSSDGLPDSRVVCVCEDRQGTLWATTALGVARFDDGRFVTEPTLFGVLNEHVIYYFEGRDGSSWLGLRNGFVRAFGGALTTYGPPVWFVLEAGDGSVWGYADGVLGRFRDGTWTTYQIKDELPGYSAVTAYAFAGASGEVCVLTPRGLARFEDGKRTFFAAMDVPADVRVAFEDREGDLWVGCDRTGLHRFKEAQIVAYSAAEGLADESFVPIADDGEGGLWLGATRIFHYRAGTFTSLPYPTNAWALARDDEGGLWIGEYGRLRRLKNGQLTEYPLFEGIPVVALYRNRAGVIWIGTLRGHYSNSSGGLYAFRNGGFTHYEPGFGLIDGNVRVITEDREGALWIGTEGGLSRLKDGEFTSYTTEQGLSHNYVREIYEDADGALWIGTYGGGLNRLKDGRFARITTDEGLFDNVVSRVLEDDRGNFWMSSNRGIFRASRRELNDLADGKITTITCVGYGVRDGMRSSECNGGGQPAGWKGEDGRLWFPTITGVAVVDPHRYNPLPPPLAVDRVLVDQRAADAWQGVEAPPGKGDLEIHYTALSFVAPEKVRFKYRLEGYDDVWVDAGARRVAYYTNLPPGRYAFRVIAANNDGVWNEEGAALEIYLRPHFYETWWFDALAAAALAAIVLVAYRRHTSRLRRRHAEQQAFSRQLIESQESERKRIAAELHDSLGQSLAIIRNRAALSLSRPEDAERAFEQLAEIGEAASEALNEVKEIVSNLRPYQLERLGLTRAIESMLKRAFGSNGIRYTAEVDPVDGVLSKGDEINLYRVVQEGVNNVVKHAAASEVRVLVRRSERELAISIEDDGRGFDPNGAGTGGPPERAFGLLGIAERTRMIGGRSAIRSAPGRGTSVSITIDLSERQHED